MKKNIEKIIITVFRELRKYCTSSEEELMINDSYYDDYDLKENLPFDSKTVHGGLGCDPITGAVSFPIFQTATFRHRDFQISTGYDYTRLQNPTRQ